MLEDLRRRTELVRAALARIADMVARFGRASIQAGAAGVFYAITGYGSAVAMPLREYEEPLLPLDRQVLAACSGGWFNMLHLWARANTSTWRLPCRPHASTGSSRIRATRASPKAEGSAARRSRAACTGIRRSPTAAPEQVVEQPEAALLDTGGHGHLLTPGCSVSAWPWDREDNFRAMVQAASARRYDA